METRVRSVLGKHIKRGWGLVPAYLVPIIPSRQLEATHSHRVCALQVLTYRLMPVSATPGTQRKMESHARSVIKTPIKRDRALGLV